MVDTNIIPQVLQLLSQCCFFIVMIFTIILPSFGKFYDKLIVNVFLPVSDNHSLHGVSICCKHQYFYLSAYLFAQNQAGCCRD